MPRNKENYNNYMREYMQEYRKQRTEELHYLRAKIKQLETKVEP